MKKLILSAGFAALLAVAGGAVQAADQNIVIGASVSTSCTITSPGPGSASIPVTSGFVDTTPIVNTYPVSCNAPATATLTSVSDGLGGPAAASGFENHINYSAGTTGFVTIVGTTTTSGVTANNLLGSSTTPGASATPVNVQINPVVNINPLVAGSYSDTLTLAINPT
jgi:hypothetical protein